MPARPFPLLIAAAAAWAALAAPAGADSSLIVSLDDPPQWRSARLSCGRTYEIASTFSAFARLTRFRLGLPRAAGAPVPAPPSARFPPPSAGASPQPDDPLGLVLLDGVPRVGDHFTIPNEACLASSDRLFGVAVSYRAEGSLAGGGLAFSIRPEGSVPEVAVRPGTPRATPPPVFSSRPRPSPSPTQASPAGRWACQRVMPDHTVDGSLSLHERGGAAWTATERYPTRGERKLNCQGGWIESFGSIDVDLTCEVWMPHSTHPVSRERGLTVAYEPPDTLSGDGWSCERR